MKKTSKIIGLFLLVPVITILLFAGNVLADNDNDEVPFDEFYVYYENEDEKMVKADYVEAIEAAAGATDEVLYLAIVDGIRSALLNARDVWVEVTEDEDGDPKKIDYGKAFEDGKNLADVIKKWEEDYEENYGIAIDEGDIDRVLAIKDGEARELPYEDQPWVKEVEVLYSDIINEWCVRVIFDFDDDLFDNYEIDGWDDFDLEKDTNNIHIRGSFVGEEDDEKRSRRIRDDEIIDKVTIDDNDELRVFIKDEGYFTSDVDDIEPVVGERDIKVTIKGNEYSYYTEVD